MSPRGVAVVHAAHVGMVVGRSCVGKKAGRAETEAADSLLTGHSALGCTACERTVYSGTKMNGMVADVAESVVTEVSTVKNGPAECADVHAIHGGASYTDTS